MASKTTVAKNAKGYGYKYTDIGAINEYLESQGVRYRQYVETLLNPVTGDPIADYVWTVPVYNGEAAEPIRGCRVVDAPVSGKTNPAQAHGSALTYARRYSLLLAFGLATVDDDAEVFTQKEWR